MRIFGYEPAVIAYALNAGVSLLVAFGLELSTGQVQAISVITTAILAAAVAAMTRPVVVSTITGAAATVMAAVAAFGLEFNAEQIGATVGAMSIALALLLRQNVSPAPPVTAPAPDTR